MSTSAVSCSKPHQLPGFPPWGLHCPRSRSAQDTRPRTLGVSRMTSSGSSQAWNHRTAVLSCTTTQPKIHNMYIAMATPVSSSVHCPGVRGPCSSPGAIWGAHPSTGFFLKVSRTSFVLIQTKNKGLNMLVLNMLVPIRPEVNSEYRY